MNDGPSLDDGSTHEKLDAILAALARLERRLGSDAGTGIANPEQPPVDPQVERLLLAGEKIAAIKQYRAQTATSLTQAKSDVEAIERRMMLQGVLVPTRFRSAQTSIYIAMFIAIAIAAITAGLLVAVRH
jgi:hypothetical protein